MGRPKRSARWTLPAGAGGRASRLCCAAAVNWTDTVCGKPVPVKETAEGAKPQATFAGRSAQARRTVPVKPAEGVTWSASAAEPPVGRVTAGSAGVLTLKDSGAVTIWRRVALEAAALVEPA